MTSRVEPQPCHWELPDPAAAPAGREIVGVGADCEPGTMLAGYRRGLFAMEIGPGLLGWYSPEPRGILERVHVSRSLRRSMRRFRITFDVAFEPVLVACADPDRSGSWITQQMSESYLVLQELGWAHSVEVWDGDVLAGGLFGVEIGGFFAGESMFHRVSNASKAAMVAMHERLRATAPQRLFDVQWLTPHLASMGAIEVPRAEYLRRLRLALVQPPVM